MGTKNLHEILSDRDSIAGAMQVCRYCSSVFFNKSFYFLQALLDEATADWGIKVERVEM